MKELSRKEILSNVFGAGDCWGLGFKFGDTSVCLGTHIE